MIRPEELSPGEYPAFLEALHGHLLVIAVEIRRICDAHGLVYCLVGGSLLGAVRHRGFIPWDDDMDIGLPREDYERFLRLCGTELGSAFELVTTRNGGYGLPFAKIMLKGTVFRERNAPQYDCGNGIYVDVFPLDRIPDGGLARKLYQLNTLFFRYALLKKCGYRDTNPRVTLWKRFVSVYARCHSKRFLAKKMDRSATAFNGRRTACYFNTGTAYPFGREVFAEESLAAPLPELPFEGIMFRVPRHADAVLRQLYGDYMVLPPEDQRYNRHGIVNVDFGDGEAPEE
ncbi:MAG: LicD family protein [Clostridia bacterium]|nr:LicD family protein [Clostridia bacterium]MBQ9721146.1 LicD family protein [Oscillospiraceae bacterium]